MASFLSDMFGGGAEAEAAQKDIQTAANYQNLMAVPTLQQYYGTATGALNQGIGAYTPLANLGATYSSGAPTLMNALGVNGPQGNAAATAAFQASPSYSYTLGQGLDALSRQRAIGGMGASGNADMDAMQYAQNLSNQDYQQWISNLQNAGQLGATTTATAAQGQAAGYGGLANLASNMGQNLTNVYGNTEQQMIGANNLQAAGEAAGAKNLLGAGLSLATLAATGGMSGLGSALGAGLTGLGASGLGGAIGNMSMGSMPATGAGAPSNYQSNMYALSQGINPW